MTFLHGPVVICRVGIDVNSLSSAWPRKVLPFSFNTKQSLAGDMSPIKWQSNNDRKKNSSMKFIFEFWCICIIYTRTCAHFHAHLQTTPADTVHTPHTDEWLVAIKQFPQRLEWKKIMFIFGLEVFSKCGNSHIWPFFVWENLLYLLMKEFPSVHFNILFLIRRSHRFFLFFF